MPADEAHHWNAIRDDALEGSDMLLIIPLVVVSLVIVLALWPQAFRRARPDNLGTMSENWLAECNASRRTPPH